MEHLSTVPFSLWQAWFLELETCEAGRLASLIPLSTPNLQWPEHTGGHFSCAQAETCVVLLKSQAGSGDRLLPTLGELIQGQTGFWMLGSGEHSQRCGRNEEVVGGLLYPSQLTVACNTT